jgi:hypothetical protein
VSDFKTLLLEVCEADPRWFVQGHADNNFWGITLDEDYFIGIREDGELDPFTSGEALWWMQSTMIARCIELRPDHDGPRVLDNPEAWEYVPLSTLESVSAASITARNILTMWIAWQRAVPVLVKAGEKRG